MQNNNLMNKFKLCYSMQYSKKPKKIEMIAQLVNQLIIKTHFIYCIPYTAHF